MGQAAHAPVAKLNLDSSRVAQRVALRFLAEARITLIRASLGRSGNPLTQLNAAPSETRPSF